MPSLAEPSPTLLAHAAFFLASVYYVASGAPDGVAVRRWTVELAYAGPPPGAYRVAIFAFIVVPQTLGALGYASLLARTRDPALRYRIALVSLGVGLWSVTTLLQGSGILPHADAFQVAIRVAGLAAVFLVLAAYLPPAFLRRRFEDAANAA